MDVVIHSFPSSGWQNFFHTGSSDGIRWPGIWLHPTSGGGSYAGFRLHCPGVPNSVGSALNLEQTYHIVIEYTQSWLYVEIDGTSVYDASHQSHTNYDSMTVYGSDPWYTAADVTVSNVIIWSGAEAPPTTAAPSAEPSPAPTPDTASPSTAPSQEPTSDPARDCSV